MLVDEGLAQRSAKLLSTSWVAEEDFLIKDPGKATHIAANPPYLRWSKVPGALAEAYRPIVRSLARKGDISVAFLDRMREWLSPNGEIVALVSDRWMLAQYGEEFLNDCMKEGWRVDVLDECTRSPFVRSVGVSAVVVRLSRASFTSCWRHNSRRQQARLLRERLVLRHGTLSDAGCEVRVGPALGCGKTFVVSEDYAAQIEPDLVRTYVDRASLEVPRSSTRTLKLIIPYGPDGELVVLSDFPLFNKWVEGHREKLSARSQVRNGLNWWRTIDAVGPIWSNAPKLLLPELTRSPQVEVDYSNAIPAHSIYAIWPGSWPATPLKRVLNAGLLQLEADAEAPTLKANWYRFYKRFIIRTPLPSWEILSDSERSALADGSERKFSQHFRKLFEFEPMRGADKPSWLLEME